MNQLIRMGAALGLGIVLGAWVVMELRPATRVRPCPQPSFHHAPRQP